MPEQLQLELTAPNSVVRGEFFFLGLTLRNQGDTTATVSTRLNLSESDLFIHAELPDGNRVKLHGHAQIDSLPSFVELAPGAKIEASCSVFYTNYGFAFDLAGSYRLMAEYFSYPGKPPVVSNSVEVTLLPESNDQQRRRAAQTMLEDFARGLASCEANGVEETFEALISEFPDSQAATAAGMVLAMTKARSSGSPKASEELVACLTQAAHRDSPAQVARLAMSIAPPAPSPNDPLLTAIDALLESAAAENEDAKAIRESLRQTWQNPR